MVYCKQRGPLTVAATVQRIFGLASNLVSCICEPNYSHGCTDFLYTPTQKRVYYVPWRNYSTLASITPCWCRYPSQPFYTREVKWCAPIIDRNASEWTLRTLKVSWMAQDPLTQWKCTSMPSACPGWAPPILLLSEREASLFEILKASLPERRAGTLKPAFPYAGGVREVWSQDNDGNIYHNRK